ncbi:MAG: CPBP family intramembrane glutamic endopeptidase [Acidimicrobiales bacterium]
MVALGVLLAVLAGANVARSVAVPDAAHFWFNVGTAVVVVGIGLVARLDRDELGTARATVGSGLRWGALSVVVVTAGVMIAALVPATRGYLEDPVADVDTAEMLRRTALVIPLGTVALEELAFRGVLLGLLLRATTVVRAAVVASVVFGLWHVLPAWQADGPLVAAGTLVATTIAGAGFTWLRLHSGSLLAPTMAHLATNSVTFGAAWAVTTSSP